MSPIELLQTITRGWVDDPNSDVVWAGEHEGRWGLRMAQQARDFTTVWFDVGDITIGFEAYLLPPPRFNAPEVLSYCLKRNYRSWPAYIAADDRGELYVRGRIPVTNLAENDIETAVGAIYQLSEISFQPLLRRGYVTQSG